MKKTAVAVAEMASGLSSWKMVKLLEELASPVRRLSLIASADEKRSTPLD